MATIWAPASQESSHVGNAGVGVTGMRGAPVALPTFATAQFKRFFDCGACCHQVLVGLCIWWFYVVIRVLILMLSSFL